MSKVLGSNPFKKKLLSSFQLGEEFLFGRKTHQCLNFISLIRENVGDVDERRQAVQPDPGSVVAGMVGREEEKEASFGKVLALAEI